MKKTNFIMNIGVIIAFVMTFNFCDLQAQKQIIPDAKLYAMMGQEDVDLMLQIAPQKVAHYNCFLNQSFYISSELPENHIQKGDISHVTQSIDESQFFNEDISLIKSSKFNRLKYNFRADLDKYTVYTIGNSGEFIIFYPETIYLQKEKAYFQEYGLKH